MESTLSRRVAVEGLGSAFLLAAIVGSGIMAERLAGSSAALALLANSLATGATLVALLFALGPISGGHFNPAVTLAEVSQGRMPWRELLPYWAGQVLGAAAGVAAAHSMFSLPLLQQSNHARGGGAQLFSELVATFGLLAIIMGCARARAEAVPFAVGLYVTGAYWFTASTSFANPAVTLARSFTDTFSGIRPADAPGFIVVEFAGALVASAIFSWLRPSRAGEERAQ